jgi:hypothetical protein
MNKHKKLLAICCGLMLILGVISLSMPHNAYSQATIPTRTPKPDPTDDDGGGGGGGGGSEPKPTDEPAPTPEPSQEPLEPTGVPATAVPTLIIPTNTPLPTISATLPSATETPVGSIPPTDESPSGTVEAETIQFEGETIQFEGEIVAFPENNEPFPQASVCGLPPTFTAREAISVFAGPGEDYPMVGLVGENQVRPIIGRAVFVSWWLVQLDESGRAGWVSDDLGTVHGFIERVPIINAPNLNGIAPTPGSSPWVPTAPAVCDAPELVIGAAIDDQVSDSTLVPPSGKPDSLKNLYNNYDDQTGEEMVSGGLEVEAQAGEALKSEERAENMLAELAESAQPLTLTNASASGQQLPNLMPVAGLVLILAAVVVGVFARRSGSSSDIGE